MKIAILGAPGSGKSGFASKLMAELNTKPKRFGNYRVVDKYIDKLQKQTGFNLQGASATIPQNFQILFERWTAEQKAALGGNNIIVCGSIYESILYAAIRVNNEVMREVPGATSTARATMQGLAMIEAEISDHDLFFYLPLKDKVKEQKGKSYDTVVDEKLPEVVSGYFKELIGLTGTDKEKVKSALTIIRASTEEQAEPPLDD